MTQLPSKEILDRLPPADIETEIAILSAVIVDPSVLDSVSLHGSDFYDRAYGSLFDAMRTLRESGIPIGDVRVLVPELQRMRLPESVSSIAFMGGLIGKGVASNAWHYASRIRTCARLRGMIDTGTELLKRSYDDRADPDQIAAWLDAAQDAMRDDHSSQVRLFKDVASDVFDELDKSDRRSVMTGILPLDNVIGGLFPGELYLLAARPGIGKTAMGSQIAVYSAKQERGVLFASLEMTDLEQVQRVLCGEAKVNGMDVRTRDIDSDDRRRLFDAAGQLAHLPLWIWSPAGTTFSRLRAVAKVHHAAHPLRLLVVDYIGLVMADNPRLARFEHIAGVSNGLKLLAKELSIPVLALAQLNREADGDAAPRLSQLRDSGALEQDADVVLFLHRPKGNCETDCIIAKNRHGLTGKFKLAFDPVRTRFEECRNHEFDKWNEEAGK